MSDLTAGALTAESCMQKLRNNIPVGFRINKNGKLTLTEGKSRYKPMCVKCASEMPPRRKFAADLDGVFCQSCANMVEARVKEPVKCSAKDLEAIAFRERECMKHFEQQTPEELKKRGVRLNSGIPPKLVLLNGPSEGKQACVNCAIKGKSTTDNAVKRGSPNGTCTAFCVPCLRELVSDAAVRQELGCGNGAEQFEGSSASSSRDDEGIAQEGTPKKRVRHVSRTPSPPGKARRSHQEVAKPEDENAKEKHNEEEFGKEIAGLGVRVGRHGGFTFRFSGNDWKRVCEMCLREGQVKKAEYGEDGNKIYCINHAKSCTMQIGAARPCQGCVSEGRDRPKHSHYGFTGCGSKWCAEHFEENAMYNPTRICVKCKAVNEYDASKRNYATYGVVLHHPERCQIHKYNDDYELIMRKCIECGQITLLTKDRKCGDCAPDPKLKGMKPLLKGRRQFEVRQFLEQEAGIRISYYDQVTPELLRATEFNASRLRPDMIIEPEEAYSKYTCVLEVDENQHKHGTNYGQTYADSSDLKRMETIAACYHKSGRDLFFIRYNPDKYKPVQGEQDVKVTNKVTRLGILADFLRSARAERPLALLHEGGRISFGVLYLFYDEKPQVWEQHATRA